MSWFKVDDRLHSHRKVLSIPRGTRRLVAMGAWTIAGSWASGSLTDGYVPRHILDELGIPKKVAADLVTAGLWDEVDGGFQFHDFLQYNPSAVQVEATKVGNARRQALVRDPQLRAAIRERDGGRCRYCGQLVVWTDRRSTTGGTYDHVDPAGPNSMSNLVVACRGCNARKGSKTPNAAGMPLLPVGDLGQNSDRDLDTTQVQDLDSHKAPTRPDPTRPDASNEASEKPLPRKRATPAPDIFPITDAMRSWAAANAPLVNLDRETSRFLDHHRAKGSTFKDWVAAWRTWMGRAVEFAPKAAGDDRPEWLR